MAHADRVGIEFHLFTGDGPHQKQPQAQGKPQGQLQRHRRQPGQRGGQGQVEAHEGEADQRRHRVGVRLRGRAHRSSADPGSGSISSGGL